MASNIRVLFVIIVCAITLLLPKKSFGASYQPSIRLPYPQNLTLSCNHIDELALCASNLKLYNLIKDEKIKKSIYASSEAIKAVEKESYICNNEEQLENCFTHYMRKTMSSAIFEACGVKKMPEEIAIKHAKSIFSWLF